MNHSLRYKASKIALKNMELSDKNFEMLSLEAIKLMIHELEIHQIELELQNNELRQAKIELNAERERYIDLYDSAPVGYVSLDKEGLVVEANLTAATLLGIRKNELIQQPITHFIYREDQDIYYLYRKKFVISTERESCELRMIQNDGSLLWVYLVATTTQDRNSRSAVRLVVNDITEKKLNELLQNERTELISKAKFQEQIVHLQSRYSSIGELTGNIAHQWKQPLHAIGSIQTSIKTSLLYEDSLSKDMLLESVNTSFILVQHLSKTIDTFYSFLSQKSCKTYFIIGDELETIQKLTEYSFENSHIQLLFELHVNPTIQGNGNEFTNAMLNLILNAKDALDNSHSGTLTITVTVDNKKKNCTIIVTDNGGGIQIEPIESIFESHISSKEEGSGIGLYITKNILEERFGGTIMVENANGGARFTIEIPNAEHEENFTDTDTIDERA